MVYYYNPLKTFSGGVLSIEATILVQVWRSFEFWFFILVHTGFTVYLELYEENNGGRPSWFQPLDTFMVSKMGSFIMFVLVFFVSECYQRYKDLYMTSMALDEGAKNFVKEMMVYLNGPQYRDHVRLAAKYLVACIFLHYFRIAGPGAQVDDDEWEKVLERGLLTPAEIGFLRKCGRRQKSILTSWAERVALDALQTCKPDVYSPPEKASLENRFAAHSQEMEAAFRRVENLLAMPIPFAYYHLMNTSIVVDLILLSWTLNGLDMGAVAVVVPYIVAAILLLGLKFVAAHLADPFRQERYDRLRCAMPLDAMINSSHDEIIMLIESIERGCAPDPVKGRLADSKAGRLDASFKSFDPKFLQQPVITGERTESMQQGNPVQKMRRFHAETFVGVEDPHVGFKWDRVSQEGLQFASLVQELRRMSPEEEHEDPPSHQGGSAADIHSGGSNGLTAKILGKQEPSAPRGPESSSMEEKMEEKAKLTPSSL